MAKTTTHADYTATALTLTTAAQPNITTLGTLTTLTVDDITINGSTISDGGDLTLDVAGDIILDAGGNEIKLKTAGTEWGQIYNSSSDLAIYSAVQDKDIKLQGNDGGSVITALTLDMSDAGKAIFNSDLTIGNAAGNNQTLQVTNDNGNFQLQKYSDDVYLNLNDNGSIIFRHYGSSGSSVSQIFSFLPSGIAHFSNYVGIGISTNTANELHVKTDTDGNGITIQRDSTTENTYSQLGFSQTTNDAGTPNLWIRGYRGSSFADNFMTLGTNNTETMRIDSNGNFSLGGGGNASNFSGYVTLDLRDTTGGLLDFSEASAGVFARIQGVVNNSLQVTNRQAYPVIFSTNDTERMRIDGSGVVLIGKTANDVTGAGHKINANGETFHTANTTSVQNTLHVYDQADSAYRFYVGQAGTGAGTINATNTSISAISDERLKENIKDLETGLSEVMSLKPRRFDWKKGEGSDIKNVAGFIAQEVETVLPDLIGNYLHEELDDAKSVRMGDMVPTLVKAIQELSAEVEELKAKLESK